MKTYFMYVRNGVNRNISSNTDSIEGATGICIKNWVEEKLGIVVQDNQYITISKKEAKRIWEECLNPRNEISELITFNDDTISSQEKTRRIERLRRILKDLIDGVNASRSICYYNQVENRR